ncbi:ATP-binding cassette domain-containing protein [Streptomyces massasporeus]|uniref:ABC transporter ATP-binding protein n=1 Tax=Streptomyces massasporeus TaxID=67324 RepID=UPI0037ADF0DF
MAITLLRCPGEFTAQDLGVLAGIPTDDELAHLMALLRYAGLVAPVLPSATNYEVTSDGLRWAGIMEGLLNTPRLPVRNVCSLLGRVLLEVYEKSSERFTVEELEVSVGFPVERLEERMRAEGALFSSVSHGSRTVYSLTEAGARNAMFLQYAWRGLYPLMLFPYEAWEPTAAQKPASRVLEPPEHPPGVISVKGLTKSYEKKRMKGETETVHAVKGVDFSVAAGEIVGFLGPNGAGKTTCLRMLATLLRPTSGEVFVGGCDLLNDVTGVRRRIGYVAQENGSSPNSTVVEELRLQGRIQGLSKRESRVRATELIRALGLSGLKGRLTKNLSGGQRRRLDIALGLVHTPDVLLLDEPSTGLDPHHRANLWEHIARLRSEHGTTVFMTTHYLDEADALCDRILVMDDGRVIAEGSPDELKTNLSGDGLVVAVSQEHEPTAAHLAGKLPGAGDVLVDNGTIRVRVPKGDVAAITLLRMLDESAIPTLSLHVSRPSLDDVFLALTGRSLREKGKLAA